MNFDRLAPFYDTIEALTAGGHVQRARVAWLDQLKGKRRILTLGEGHGRFLAAALEALPDAEFVVVEGSPKMMARAQRRTASYAGRVIWHNVDVFAWEPDVRFDAVVTCFFLDCFPPDALTKLIARVAQWTELEALWLVVDFTMPERGLSRWRARLAHGLMYTFFRALVGLPARRLTPPDADLEKQRFQLEHHRTFDWGLIRSDVWRKETGPTGRS